MRTILILAALLLAAPASAASLPWSVADGGVDAAWTAAMRKDPQATLHFYVQSTTPAATRRLIETAGGSVGTVAGDVLTVRMRADALPALLGHRGIVALEAAHLVRPRLDEVLPAMDVPPVHDGEEPLTRGYRGTGVLVGVIDYGLDLSHRAFTDDDEVSRVRALWTHASSGTPPDGYSYGDTCSEESLRNDTCDFEDGGSHGNHVTGIAAGRAWDDVIYEGLAPDADIAFVNLGDYPPGIDDEDLAFSTSVCDGASWIFSVADARDQPAVVNMSLGTHEGPHDGTSLANQCLDNLAGEGRILVAAAGNEGDGNWAANGDTVHVHAQGSANSSEQLVHFIADTNEAWPVVVVVWFDAGTDVQVALGAQDGQEEDWSTWAYTAADPYEIFNVQPDSELLGEVEVYGIELASGSRAVRFNIWDTDGDGSEVDVAWMLAVTGDGPWDAFIDTTSGSGFVGAQDVGVTADHRMTIGYPADSEQVLAVGATVTRIEWTSVYGNYWNSGETLGDLASFSSVGPGRNPDTTGLLPDIAAPGSWIASALNVNSPADTEICLDDIIDGLIGEPNGFVMSQGTSMASPATVGGIALLLEAANSLAVEEIRGLFEDSAAGDSFTGALPNNDFGNGKFEVFAAMELAVKEYGDDDDATADDDDATADDDDAVAQDDDDAADDDDDAGTGDGCEGCQAAPGAGASWLALLTPLLWRRRR